MKRPIEFRIWFEEEKKFRHCEFIPTMGFNWGNAGTHIEIGEEYPQQFTGIIDKFGKKVWEGDIIKTDRGILVKVIFEYGAFVLENINSQGTHPDFYYNCKNGIVVGHVFETFTDKCSCAICNPNDFDKIYPKTEIEKLAAEKALTEKPDSSKCGCAACNPGAWWMIVCDKCGNKRCPRARNHKNECTNSNESNQPCKYE